MTNDEKIFIPKILLLGNGLNNWSEYHSWTDLLKGLCSDPEIIKYFNDDKHPKKLPMSMQAVLATGDNISDAVKQYNLRNGYKRKLNPFYGKITSEKQKLALQNLLTAGFDAILTTNYSYELELAASGKEEITSEYQIKKLSESLNGKAEQKYHLHTYNKVVYQGVENRIFHIHGEARKPSGIILGSYYYANLLQRIINEANSRGNRYHYNQIQHKQQQYDSWVDYFILGDVYVLGFGFDFAEIDLWWLLNRKKNEKAITGKVYYYAPFYDGFDEKNAMLKLMNVNIENFGIFLEEGRSETANRRNSKRYDQFYTTAISSITAA